MLVIITAKINYHNHALLNRIDEAASRFWEFILICAIFLVQINIKHWVKYPISTLLTGILLVSLLFFLIANNLCSEEILFKSENNRYDLLIVRKNCGATTSYEYKVLLQDKDAFLLKEKVIFKSYAYPAPSHVKFLNDNTIRILSTDGDMAPHFVVSFDKKTLNTDKTLKFYNGKPY